MTIASPGLAALGCGTLASALLLALMGWPILPSYLFAWMVIAAVPLGALPMLMLLELMGGRWTGTGGVELRRAVRVLPLVAVLFLPVMIFQPRIYPWAGSGLAAGHASEIGYLSASGFTMRSLLYFGLWLALAHVFGKQRATNRTGLAAGGLVLHTLLVTFAAIDWTMSLEPDWRSSGYGLMVMHMQVTAALAFACWRGTRNASPVGARLDLGTMLFAAVIVWAYLAFMHFLVIWSADLPEEIVWYIRRGDAGWQAVVWLVVTAHFIVPFFVLISRQMKAKPGVVSAMGGLVLVAGVLDFAWLILPAFRRDGFSLSIQDPLVLVGLVGLALWAYGGTRDRAAGHAAVGGSRHV
ncbi:hypothetical protein [Marinivivus vitaminiproducens]|uniref:hypothetical protein n=1 Tax=Marinivivus vitaminiproducens TaxID=3035935 RepID=UPI00279C0462|nr:hypothetical protein P4R82_10615 [Geminicoccaceae bacterium SCSIO 64248]